MKFGTTMHIRPSNMMVNQKFQNPIWRTAAILKIKISCYLRNRVADFGQPLYSQTGLLLMHSAILVHNIQVRVLLLLHRNEVSEC